MSFFRRLLLLTATLLGSIGPALAEPHPDRREPPVAIRVEWGDGRSRAWAGTIAVVGAAAGNASDRLAWQSLCEDPDAAASIHATGNTLHVHDPRPRDRNGVQVAVDDWRTARLVVRLAPVGDAQPVTEIDVAVAEVLVDAVPRQLDADGNRLTIRRAAAEAIRVTGASGRWPEVSPVHRPGEVVRLTVDPLLVSRSGATAARELSMRVRDLTAGVDLAVESRLIHASDAAAVPVGDGLAAQGFESVVFDVTLPERDAVCQVAFEVIERGSLRWSRPVASRTIELVAVSDAPPTPAAGEWKVVYELDPASPRLHERLRRLSGSMPSVSMPSLPLPSVKLPALPFPSMTRPNIPLPKMPNVPLPSVSAMVPRMSGLLASGDSTVGPHAGGTVLRLPPAAVAERPSWEGILVAGVDVGMPHLVEIEYPLHQRATFGLTVLEAGGSGARVESRHAGGFEVVPPVPESEGGEAVGRHSFIFWPATRNPVVVVFNLSAKTPALFGKVRVFAGPSRVPPMPVVGTTAAAGGTRAVRRINGFVSTPAELGFGAGGSVGGGAARLPPDWNGIVLGVQRSAEWLAAQGAGGAMITVYREGAAIWPSALTQAAPRWFGSGDTETAPKDVVDAIARVYGREGLRFVPALSFDAPLPEVESLLARHPDTAVGIALVGGDGRPRRSSDRAAGVHYNILDARVQQAVEAVVGELVGRVGRAAAVDGVAILLRHDGWMHFPGVAWGLDDATFTRFAADVGVESPTGEGRHAAREGLVTGPLRDVWLGWRSREVASFYRRLATIVGEAAPGRSLYVAPTTLLAAGPATDRLRPTLSGAGVVETDLWREVGVDPVSLTEDARVVFLSPHVHEAGGSLVERGAIDRGNRSPALAAAVAGASRRGVVAVEIPAAVSVADVVPHGAFGDVAADGDVAVHAVSSGAAATRPWAESLVAGDAEVIFDMGLMYAQPTFAALLARRCFTALPPGPMALVDPLPAPLVIRSAAAELGTAILVVNASALPVRAEVALAGRPTLVADAIDGARLPLDDEGRVSVALEPWGVRTVVVDRGVTVAGARALFDEPVRQWVATRLADLDSRREAVETPVPLAVLDNPGFDLPGSADGVTGWELVDRQRGSLTGLAAGRLDGGRAAEFSSTHGLATLRSNPFPAPATGRIGVAAWLRVAENDPQPPLRLAIEGVTRGGEYYRFAPVGGIAGGKPLAAAWTQFVLHLDDLPAAGLESVRVRFDLMGPGRVQIDDVQVDGLAFRAAERDQISRLATEARQRLAVDDVGGCGLMLDSFWPQFLAVHVPLSAGADPPQPGGQPIARPPKRWKWR